MDAHSRQQITIRFVDALEKLNVLLSSGRFNDWTGKNLTITQFNILATLETQGPLRIELISSLVGVDLAATTSMVEYLVNDKLINLNLHSADPASAIYELSEIGRQLMEGYWANVGAGAIELADHLEPKQLYDVSEAMKLISNTLREFR